MRFNGDYEFLSNFYEAPIIVNNIPYRNTEAAFQSFKLLDKSKRSQFSNLSGPEAKALGRKVDLREDWDQIKDQVMEGVVGIKFKSHPELKAKLLAVQDPIVEDNTWNDTYWGVCNGKGENKLGQILTELRADFIKETAPKKSLAFTGHRPKSAGENFGYDMGNEYWTLVREKTKEFIKDNKIEKVYDGMALGYDQVALEACLDLKKEGYDIEIVAAVPCRGHSSKWPKKSQDHYNELLSQCDEVVLVTDKPYSPALMQIRNEYMVDNADEVLAFHNGKPSGTGNAVNYAQNQGKKVSIILPDDIIKEISELRTKLLTERVTDIQKNSESFTKEFDDETNFDSEELKEWE